MVGGTETAPPTQVYALNFAPMKPIFLHPNILLELTYFHLKTTPNNVQHAKGDTYFADLQLWTD